MEKELAKADLYALLDVPRTADEDQIRKAYRRKSLACHPDRVTGTKADKDVAEKEFLRISFAHKVLTDKRQRQVYDSTGRADGALSVTKEDWAAHWAQCFPDLSKSRIDELRDSYVGSKKERVDVLRIYNETGGDMDVIVDSVPFTDDKEREDAVRDIILQAIEVKKVKVYRKFVEDEEKGGPARREARRRRDRARFEAAERKRAGGRGRGSQAWDGDEESGQSKVTSETLIRPEAAEMFRSMGLPVAPDGSTVKDAAAAMAQGLLAQIKAKAEKKLKRGLAARGNGARGSANIAAATSGAAGGFEGSEGSPGDSTCAGPSKTVVRAPAAGNNRQSRGNKNDETAENDGESSAGSWVTGFSSQEDTDAQSIGSAVEDQETEDFVLSSDVRSGGRRVRVQK